MTGAARGVCAGVLGSLLLISPAEAEAEPDAAPFPPAGRLGCFGLLAVVFRGAGVCLIIFAREEDIHGHPETNTHTHKQEADKTGKDPQTAGSEQTGGKLKLNSQTGSGSGRGAAVVQMAAAIYSQAPPPSFCSSLPPAIVLLYVLFLS